MSFIKMRWRYILVALIALLIGGSVGPSQSEVDASTESNENLQTQIQELESTNETSEKKIEELETKVKEAEPFFALEEAERKEKEAELKKKEEEVKAKEEAEKAAAKAKEEAEAKEKEEAEAKAAAQAKAEAEEQERIGYETGITYDQLARTPDDYVFEKVKFRGKVIQVMEGDGVTQLRIAVNDNYDTVIYGEFDASIVDSRVLEDDMITIRGLSTGLLTYESTMGGSISIPGISIEKIDQ
ncbi:toxin regulator [Planococcus maritimus]|nr:toxin regulator [Planococcus maritimus]